jgi:phosphatidate cytidylyltransferase
MSPLVSRLLVAVVGLPIVLALVYAGGWWLFGLLLLATLIALHEYWAMIRSLHPLALAGYLAGIATLLGAKLGGIEWMLGGLLLTLLTGFALYVVATTRQPATVAIGSTFLGVGWIACGTGSLLLLRELPKHDHPRLIAFTVLLAVFAADTAAYAIGRLIGRHKLSPQLSPGKTWEGFVAGVAAAVLVCFFALYDERKDFLPIWQALLLGLVIALAEALGDLFESTLKRDMRVKDSGHLLGGHGGILDRVDSLLFAGMASLFLLNAYGWPH